MAGTRAKRSLAAALALVVFASCKDFAWADEVPVCAMSRDEFVEAAFPDTDLTRLYRGMLLKRARPPGLVVLAPAGKLSTATHIDAAFARVANDGLVQPARSSLVTYRSFSEVMEAVTQLGNDNIFILIAEEPTDSSELEQLRSALNYIVRQPKDVDALVDRSTRAGGFTTRGRVDLVTAEVKATAVVISSRSQDAEIGSMIYLAYYAAVSLNASSTETFLSRFFERTPETGAELTVFGRQYFDVFGDERVKNGATKDLFVECSE